MLTPAKKAYETPISMEQKLAWWYTPVIPAMAGSLK
jgi:hypothetical protein